MTQNTRDQQPRTKEAANMSDENERSVASTGSVDGFGDIVDRLSDLSGDVGRWGAKTIGEAIDEIERLRLTPEEREAVRESYMMLQLAGSPNAAAIWGLLERLGGDT